MKFDTTIIGGGLSGLVCGLRLQKAGRVHGIDCRVPGPWSRISAARPHHQAQFLVQKTGPVIDFGRTGNRIDPKQVFKRQFPGFGNLLVFNNQLRRVVPDLFSVFPVRIRIFFHHGFSRNFLLYKKTPENQGFLRGANRI